MDFNKLNKSLEKLSKFTEATKDEIWGNAIDFDNIGCGFNVKTGTTEDGFFSLYLEGYSANSGKANEFKSELSVGYDLPIEERKQANEEFKAKKEEVKQALLQIANEFDAKIIEVMKSFGFHMSNDDVYSKNESLISKLNKSFKKAITEFYDVTGMDSIEMEIVNFGDGRYELDGIEFYLGEDETLENAVDTCIEMEFFPEWEEQGLSSYNVDSVQYDEEEGKGTAYVGLFWDEEEE